MMHLLLMFAMFFQSDAAPREHGRRRHENKFPPCMCIGNPPRIGNQQ